MSVKSRETGSINHVLDNHLWDSFDWRHALFILAVMTLGMFGDVLFSSDGLILSAIGLDLYNGEMSGLDFLSRELGMGNLFPWNPHVFSGTFSLATSLYPSLMLNLFLPLSLAVNGGIALHVLLAGFFMYLWTARRGLHPLASLTTAALLMFSGPYFMHVFAGHVGNLCAMTWAPLILMAVDGMMERPSLRWALLGIFAVAMQILTGQFQYVYYMGLTAILYSLVHLSGVGHWSAALLGLFGIAVGGMLLSSFHVLPALTAAGEGVRGAGVAMSFAAMFSFPPENFLTLIAPFFFGDIQDFPYWGRCYLWEMCLFTGVAGFCMAVFGALKGDRRRRYELLVMIAILAILALGSHTPLFKLLFDWLPGFDKFRGTSKFMFFASLFWILLAGYGCDLAIRGAEREGKGVVKGDAKGEGRQESSWGAELEAKGSAGCEIGREETSGAPAAGCAAGREANPAAGSDIGWEGAAGAGAVVMSSAFAAIPLVVAAILGGLAIWLYYAPLPGGEGAAGGPSLWNALISLIAGSRESYLPLELHFLYDARQFAATGLFVAGGVALIVAGLAYLRRSSPKAVYVLVLLAIVEMFIFGRLNRPTFSYEDLGISQLKSFYAAHPGDYRVLSFVNPNTAMSTGAQDIWGYGPAALGRYVQFMAWTQGADPDKATTYLKINQYHPLFKMLRLRYVFTPGEKGVNIKEYKDWVPRISLVENWKVVGSRAEIFKEMGNPDFDPSRMVILEKRPVYGGITISTKAIMSAEDTAARKYPRSGKPGKAVIEDAKGDSIIVRANLDNEAILLVTDNYSRGWQVMPMKSGAQPNYEIIPANYTLMGIPLTAGEHLLRIEYRPRPFVVGAWISAISLLIYLLLLVFTLRRSKSQYFMSKQTASMVQDSAPSR